MEIVKRFEPLFFLLSSLFSSFCCYFVLRKIRRSKNYYFFIARVAFINITANNLHLAVLCIRSFQRVTGDSFGVSL